MKFQASDQPFCIDAVKIDKKMAERIDGELLYLSGASFVSSTILNKTIAKTLVLQIKIIFPNS